MMPFTDLLLLRKESEWKRKEKSMGRERKKERMKGRKERKRNNATQKTGSNDRDVKVKNHE